MNDKMLNEYEKQKERTYNFICEQTDVLDMFAYIYENDEQTYRYLVGKIKFDYYIMLGGK